MAWVVFFLLLLLYLCILATIGVLLMAKSFQNLADLLTAQTQAITNLEQRVANLAPISGPESDLLAEQISTNTARVEAILPAAPTPAG